MKRLFIIWFVIGLVLGSLVLWVSSPVLATKKEVELERVDLPKKIYICHKGEEGFVKLHIPLVAWAAHKKHEGDFVIGKDDTCPAPSATPTVTPTAQPTTTVTPTVTATVTPTDTPSTTINNNNVNVLNGKDDKEVVVPEQAPATGRAN